MTNNTVATPIVDKNGKQTTVHKSVDKSTQNSRLQGVSSKPPTTEIPYQRAVRTVLGVLYKDSASTIKKRRVDRSWDEIKHILGGGSYFGTMSEAIAAKLMEPFGDNSEVPKAAKKIVELAGLEDGKHSDFGVSFTHAYKIIDGDTTNVINGAVTKSITEAVSSDPSRYYGAFYTSQILNRKNSDSIDPEYPTRLGEYFDFEYMGSSEYEFGAVPKALASLRSGEEMQYAEHNFNIGGKEQTVYFIGNDVAPPISEMAHGINKYETGGRLFDQKQMGGFEAAIEGGNRTTNATQTAWLALNEGQSFIYTLDKDRATDAAKILRRDSADNQKFVKVNVNLTQE